jgi:prepilin-type N-terminal cleavage/methylation domain-containing protein/prepilin-type processing-associated H-X9-DG protein
MPRSVTTRRRPQGFSLVEVLVVIGILSLLIALLMPALSKARLSARKVVCSANLKQVHQALLLYSQANNDWMFPVGLGAGLAKEQRWPNFVFVPPQWNPPSLRCPADVDPAEEHSYVLNSHLPDYKIRFSITRGVSSAEVILMGEKKSGEPDYYMDAREGDLDRVVEYYRHGFYVGSNYLYLDGHVAGRTPEDLKNVIDPWDPIIGTPAAPAAPNPG